MIEPIERIKCKVDRASVRKNSTNVIISLEDCYMQVVSDYVINLTSCEFMCFLLIAIPLCFLEDNIGGIF